MKRPNIVFLTKLPFVVGIVKVDAPEPDQADAAFNRIGPERTAFAWGTGQRGRQGRV